MRIRDLEKRVEKLEEKQPAQVVAPLTVDEWRALSQLRHVIRRESGVSYAPGKVSDQEWHKLEEWAAARSRAKLGDRRGADA